MKKLINEWLAAAWTMRHLLVVMWRIHMGRWQVFRDRPTTFVRAVANSDLASATDRLHRGAIQAAREEMALRELVASRKGDAA